jgi:hypothetical protein
LPRYVDLCHAWPYEAGHITNDAGRSSGQFGDALDFNIVFQRRKVGANRQHINDVAFRELAQMDRRGWTNDTNSPGLAEARGQHFWI